MGAAAASMTGSPAGMGASCSLFPSLPPAAGLSHPSSLIMGRPRGPIGGFRHGSFRSASEGAVSSAAEDLGGTPAVPGHDRTVRPVRVAERLELLRRRRRD